MFLNKGEKNNYLKWYDIVVLTIIFWGSGIITSTETYIALWGGFTDLVESTTFTAADNYSALYSQAILLVIALLYLKLRNFNFKSLNIKLNLKTIILGVVIFIGSALIQDLYSLITSTFSNQLPFPHPLSTIYENEAISNVVYAAFNGFYEEIYFLGFCLAVQPKNLKWALPFSLIVRVSFHTYQGSVSAIGIGIVFGLYMYFTYKKSKSKNLAPFFIGHSIADVYGLSILQFFGF